MPDYERPIVNAVRDEARLWAKVQQENKRFGVYTPITDAELPASDGEARQQLEWRLNSAVQRREAITKQLQTDFGFEIESHPSTPTELFTDPLFVVLYAEFFNVCACITIYETQHDKATVGLSPREALREALNSILSVSEHRLNCLCIFRALHDSHFRKEKVLTSIAGYSIVKTRSYADVDQPLQREYGDSRKARYIELPGLVAAADPSRLTFLDILKLPREVANTLAREFRQESQTQQLDPARDFAMTTLSPEQCFAEKAEVEALLSVLSDLSPQQKAIVPLLIEGLERKEMAARLSTTTGTVKMQVHRLREQLKIALHEND